MSVRISFRLFAPLLLALIAGCGPSVFHPKDWSSVSVTLTRTACQAPCPVYTVTVHGTGSVDYEGLQGLPVRGHRTIDFSPDKIEMLLEAIDQAKFLSINHNDFGVGADSGYIGVTVSADGKSKEIRGVDFGGERRLPLKLFLFSPTDRQYIRFLKLTDQIESIVGTDRWTKCSPQCMALIRYPYWITSRAPDGSTILLEAIESKKDGDFGSIDGSTHLYISANAMIEAGVDVNTADNHGLTPLMAAAGNGGIELVRNLLAHGADVNARDSHRKLAFDYATQASVKELLKPPGQVKPFAPK